MPNKLVDVKVGDKFVTVGGKVIEIRSKTRKGFKILVVLTGKEIAVEDAYIHNSVEPYEEDDLVEEPVKSVSKTEEVVESLVKELVEKKIEVPVEKEVEKVVKAPKKKRGRKPKADKKPKTLKGEKKMAKTRKETKKALVLALLEQGPQTRESLANAIIEKGLSKHNDVTKEKSYASVILFNLKKAGAPVVRLERGKYVLGVAETVEAPVEEAPVEAAEE